MDKLTQETAVEKKFTALDCVKYYNSEMSDKDADFFLWEFTCYPHSTGIMLDQLYDLHKEDKI